LFLAWGNIFGNRQEVSGMSGKILWGEGLLLRPQHFQRQDQYHEQRLHKSIHALQPHAWGVERLDIDRDALASNVLRPDTCYFMLAVAN
jgi:type VI secretion system protein ImpJ